MRKVYDYLLKYYRAGNVVNMYYDFVAENEGLLQLLDENPLQNSEALIIENDVFYKRFSDDEKYDIIHDMYRLKIAKNSEAFREGGSITDIYCFSPLDTARGIPIEKLEKSINVITCQKDQDGNVSYVVNSLI